MPTSSKDDVKSLKRVLPYLLKYRGRTTLALLALILSKFANVGIPLVFKDIIDSLNTNAKIAVVLPVSLLIAYGLMRAGSALFNELRDTIFAKVRYSVMHKVSIDLLTHLHKLSLKFHLNRQTGAVMRDMERGSNSINSLMNLMLFNVIPTIIEIILISVILWTNYQPLFVVITLLTIIVYATFTMKVTEWRIKFRVTMNTKDSEASNHALDSLINFETVKYFNNENYEIKQYTSHLDEWKQAGISSQTSMSALNFGQSFIIAIGVTIIMFLAAQGVVDKEMSMGDLVLVNTFLLQLFIPLGFLGIVYSQIKHSLFDIGMMFKLFDQTPDIVDSKKAYDLKTNKCDVEFKNVNFSYNSNRTILKNINFTIPHGQKIAIVGNSGSGKSTLARLLFRFYETNSGIISIDNHNINNVSQSSLRDLIGIVPQDTVLFNNTIAYNIKYSNITSSNEQIHEAAKTANIHDFIESLPNGYDTVVGERGLKLSGGEKQRIAIARAILKKPRILVFDEATSSLDSISEQLILKEIEKISEQYTTMVIAHRLSTVVDANKIIVLKQGEIIEQGSHEELLDKKGYYSELWNKQQSH